MLPILFETTFFTLYAYPLFMGLSWGVAYYLSRYIFEKNNIETKSLTALFGLEFISSWLGAKVFFLWFSSQGHFYQYLAAENFWLGGGFVFYGGLIFGLITFFIFTLGLKKFPFSRAKYLAPGLGMGHAIGRLGCFLTGCCYGVQCDLPWAIHAHGEWRHPVQLYEASGLFMLAWFCLRWINQNKSNLYIFSRYLMFYSILRFTVEFFRGDTVRGIHRWDFSTAQWTSIGIFGFACMMILAGRRLKLLQK